MDQAYEDKLIIAPDSISYEYKPHSESKCDINIYRKWSYKTTSPLFKEYYIIRCQKCCRNTLIVKTYYLRQILDQQTATFEDGHREKINFYCPGEYFVEWFRVIKQMVPTCEYTPAVLLTNEDYE